MVDLINKIFKNIDIAIFLSILFVIYLCINQYSDFNIIRDRYQRIEVCGDIDYTNSKYFNASTNMYNVSNQTNTWTIYISNETDINSLPKQACTNKWDIVKNTEKYRDILLNDGYSQYMSYIGIFVITVLFSFILIPIIRILRD